MENLLYTIIKNDVKNDIELLNIINFYGTSLHFGPCMYIRNKYLLKNREYAKSLFKIFNVNNIDDLSFEILKQISFENQYISSNPNK